MDKLAKYRQLVKSILSEYTQYKPTGNDLEIQAIFDEQKEHYQVVTFGWEGEKGQFKSELHHCLIYLYRIPHSGYDSQDIFEDDC